MFHFSSEVEEDAETHCQRLSCCSLATLQLLIADTNGDSKILESIRSTLLTIPKFWNAYAKHKLSAVSSKASIAAISDP